MEHASIKTRDTALQQVLNILWEYGSIGKFYPTKNILSHAIGRGESFCVFI